MVHHRVELFESGTILSLEKLLVNDSNQLENLAIPVKVRKLSSLRSISNGSQTTKVVPVNYTG